MDILNWNNTTNYIVGDIVNYSSKYYECIQDNGPASTIVEPTVTALWGNYWKTYVNFPSNIPALAEAQDPSSNIDMANIASYQSLINSGDFVGAQNFLQANPSLVPKLLTASRFNELIDLVTQIAQYLDDENGLYRKFINTNINAYKDINAWNNETDYATNNIVIYNYNVYRCRNENGPSTTIYEPTVTSGWERYWKLFVANQKQYIVSETQPTGLNAGDLWFKDVTSDYE